MGKQHIASLFAAIAFTLLSGSAVAGSQEPQPAADSLAILDPKVGTLDGEVSALRKIVDKLPDISGFMQLLYTWENTDPVTSQFRVRRARITLTGDIYKQYADYNFMVDFAGTVKIIDAFVRFTPFRQLNLQVGSFRPSFSLENFNYGATTMELIDYPQIVSKMTTIGDISGAGSGAAGRDIGLQLYGGFFNKRGFSILQYYVGIFNGNGLDFNGINSDKDIVAMLRINPMKELAIIGSAYFGQWAPNGKGSYADRNRWSAGFMFDNRKWFARGECISGVTGAVPGIDGNLHTDGAYIIAGAWFGNRKAAPVIRAEYYTPDTSNRSNTDIFYTVGALYCPWKYLRLQLNYTAKTYTYDSPTGHQVLLMLTGMF